VASAQPSGGRLPPTWLAGFVAAGLVVVVGLAAAAGNPVATSPFVPGPVEGVGGAPVPQGSPSPVDQDPEGLGWLGYLVGGLILASAVVLVITLVVLAIRMLSGRNTGLLSRRVLEPEELDLLMAQLPDVDLLGRDMPVAAAVQAGLVDVVHGHDVRAAIITAWLRLEEAAATIGTPRRDTDAPDDLVQRLLGGHAVGPVRLQELAELYRRARFSRSPLGEPDRAAAVGALSAVRADLLGEPVGAGDPAGSSGTGERWPTRWN